MHGGMKIYRGAAATARQYVEADRSRADDYYLAEGSGVAMHFAATPDGVERRADMDGGTYERWVAGYDVGFDKLNQRRRGYCGRTTRASGSSRSPSRGRRPGHSGPRCTPRSPRHTTLPRWRRPRRSSAGSPPTRRHASGLGTGRCRCGRTDRGGRRTPLHLPGRRPSSTPSPPGQLPSFRCRVRLAPERLFEGPTPILFDEWQVEPRIWNKVRRQVDDREGKGLFILTGSATPTDDASRHSGAGRFSVMKMRPMSLFESGHSNGEMSLASLLQGERPDRTRHPPQLRRTATAHRDRRLARTDRSQRNGRPTLAA